MITYFGRFRRFRRFRLKRLSPKFNVSYGRPILCLRFQLFDFVTHWIELKIWLLSILHWFQKDQNYETWPDIALSRFLFLKIDPLVCARTSVFIIRLPLLSLETEDAIINNRLKIFLKLTMSGTKLVQTSFK